MRCHHSAKQCALSARSTHGVHHAIVEVNIVIDVVLGDLHVVVRVHVPLVVVCDETAVRRTLVLIALVVIVSHFSKNSAVLKVYCLQIILRRTCK